MKNNGMALKRSLDRFLEPMVFSPTGAS